VEENKEALREYVKWADALQRTMEISLRSSDPTSLWKYTSYKQFARKYNDLVKEIATKVSLPPILDLFDLDKIPGPGDTLPMQQQEIFEAVHANVSLLRAMLESQLGVVEDETAALRDFLSARLRSAIFRRPEKERDVQDALEQLLIGRGLLKGQDYDRETGRVRMSVKELVPDFILLKLSLAVEVKLVNSTRRTKGVVDEINADVEAYSKAYRNVLFVVYDTGYIRDEQEFRRDLERRGNVSVIVVKQ